MSEAGLSLETAIRRTWGVACELSWRVGEWVGY